MKQQKPLLINALTSLRFFAALLVFVYHSHIAYGQLFKYRLGDIGVGFFFILSGFIISYVYLNKLATYNKKNTLKFYAARIAKIYPMHILTLCLAAPAMMRSFGMVLGITFSGAVAVAAIANVFLLQAYFPSDVNIIYSFNNVSWTISIEMLFYTLFPFIAIGVGKFRKRMNREMLILVLLSLWLGIIGGNILLPSYVVSLPFFRLSEFMIGVCAALIFMDHMKDKKKVFLGAHDTLVELISLTLLAINVLLYPFVAHRLSVIAFLAPSLTLLIFVFSQSNGHVARFLSHKILVFLGEISFSFYMLHHLILNHITPERTMLGVIVALVTATAASAIAYVFFEEPMRLRIKTYLEKRIEKLA